MVGPRGETRRSRTSASPMPTIAPTTPSRSIVQASSPTPGSCPLRAASTSAITRAMATGSLKPASPSSTVATRSEPPLRPWRTEKTAAGSVGESAAPTISESVQPSPVTQCVATVTSPNVTRVPPMPSASTGASSRRSATMPVRSPPSTRIRISAIVPAVSSCPASTSCRAVAESRPSARPTPRNTSGTATSSRRASGSRARAASRITADAARSAARDTRRHGTVP